MRRWNCFISNFFLFCSLKLTSPFSASYISNNIRRVVTIKVLEIVKCIYAHHKKEQWNIFVAVQFFFQTNSMLWWCRHENVMAFMLWNVRFKVLFKSSYCSEQFFFFIYTQEGSKLKFALNCSCFSFFYVLVRVGNWKILKNLLLQVQRITKIVLTFTGCVILLL